MNALTIPPLTWTAAAGFDACIAFVHFPTSVVRRVAIAWDERRPANAGCGVGWWALFACIAMTDGLLLMGYLMAAAALLLVVSQPPKSSAV